MKHAHLSVCIIHDEALDEVVSVCVHLCARPLRVRLEIRMGLKGSSVPEMVIPRGPPCLLSSTVNMTEPDDSNSSTIYRDTQKIKCHKLIG